jgi:hypothetical protein
MNPQKNTMKEYITLIVTSGAIFLSIGSFCAAQEIPIEVENIFTNKGKKSLSLSFSYSDLEPNNNIESVFLIQSGSNIFNLIRIEEGESDFLTATASLRYGLTKKMEVFLKGGVNYQDNRSTSNTGGDNLSNLSRTRVGFNYKISEDNDTPALFSSFEYTVRDEFLGETFSGKSYQVGFSGYKAIDPLVFYVSTGYQKNQTRIVQDISLRVGDTFFIRPSVSFSVNDKVSLFGGFTWQSVGKTFVDNTTTTVRKTDTNLNFGTSYGISKKSYVQFFFDTGDSVTSNSFGVDWTYNF